MNALIIIPAFNESLNISSLVNSVESFNYDYLVINDKSTDETKKILKANNYIYLDLPINFGLANVTQIGFKYASDNGYDAAVVIDGDGQHKPEYISALLNEIENGYDYVIGSRFVDEKKPLSFRMIGSRILSLCILLKTGKRITDSTSGMRALGKKVLLMMSNDMNFVAEPDALVKIIRNKYNVKEVQVSMLDRENGESYFKNPIKSIKYMISVIISIMFIQW